MTAKKKKSIAERQRLIRLIPAILRGEFFIPRIDSSKTVMVRLHWRKPKPRRNKKHIGSYFRYLRAN